MGRSWPMRIALRQSVPALCAPEQKQPRARPRPNATNGHVARCVPARYALHLHGPFSFHPQSPPSSSAECESDARPGGGLFHFVSRRPPMSPFRVAFCWKAHARTPPPRHGRHKAKNFLSSSIDATPA